MKKVADTAAKTKSANPVNMQGKNGREALPATGGRRQPSPASCSKPGREHGNDTGYDTADHNRESLFIALDTQFGKGMNRSVGQDIARNGWWKEALDMAFHADNRIAFRASWCLEWAYREQPDNFRPYLPRFLSDFLQSTNGSVHRTYTKMLCGMLRRQVICPDKPQREAIAEKCFDLLIDPGTRTAVKVWAMEILCDFRDIGWVGEQLEDTVRGLSEADDCPPAMSAHCRKILQRIGREKIRNR